MPWSKTGEYHLPCQGPCASVSTYVSTKEEMDIQQEVDRSTCLNGKTGQSPTHNLSQKQDILSPYKVKTPWNISVEVASIQALYRVRENQICCDNAPVSEP